MIVDPEENLLEVLVNSLREESSIMASNSFHAFLPTCIPAHANGETPVKYANTINILHTSTVLICYCKAL